MFLRLPKIYCLRKTCFYAFSCNPSSIFMQRRATLTNYAKRLTPVEVAYHWFRRSRDFGRDIHSEFPTFPGPGPDGLYLLSSVEQWFVHWHNGAQNLPIDAVDEELAALTIARGRR
jgi:hypothetical protein